MTVGFIVNAIIHLLRQFMAMRKGGEKPKKILVAMYQLASKPADFLSYEDIVVKAFKLFPDEFSMRGYPDYPDSADIHKPLYQGLAKKGLVTASEKRFALTPRGLEIARTFAARAGSKLEVVPKTDRLSREQAMEVERMTKTEAFRFFATGQQHSILDSDMFSFFGCTIRARGSHFEGRMAACANAIQSAVKFKQPNPEQALMLSKLVNFLKEKFATEINLMKKMKSA